MKTEQIITAKTPNEILAKYLEPTDNSYMLGRIKENTDENIELQAIIGDKKKEEQWKKKSHYGYDTPAGKIRANNSAINYYQEQIARGKFRGSGRANVNKTIGLYEDKPCVAAGLIEKLMGVFIIRGKTKSFAFVVQKEGFHIGGYSYTLGYISTSNFFKIFEEALAEQGADGPAKIFDKELYEKIKKEEVVKAIQGK